jgi:hypothetical protein
MVNAYRLQHMEIWKDGKKVSEKKWDKDGKPVE